MKRVISLILAAAAMLAFSVTCLAVEETAATAARADETIVADFFKEFAKFIDAESEARYAAAAETVFKMYSTLKEGYVSDYAAFADQLKKYSDETNAEVTPVFSNMDAVKDIIRRFTNNSENADLDVLQKDIEASDSLQKLIALYTGAYIEKNSGSASGTTANNPDSEDGENEEQVIVPPVENPHTGDSSAATAAAFAVFGVSVAAIAMVVKKKNSEE